MRPHHRVITAIAIATAIAGTIGGLVASRDAPATASVAALTDDASLFALALPTADDHDAEARARLMLQRLVRARDGVVGAACWLPSVDGASDVFAVAGDAGDAVALREHAGLPRAVLLADGRTVAAPVRSPDGRTHGVVLLRGAEPFDTPRPWWPLAVLLATSVAFALARMNVGAPLRRLASLAPGMPPNASLHALADRLVDELGGARIAARIERQVRLRTRELETLARRADDHLANTAHELRTPLTSVLAAVDMVHDGYATTEEERGQFLEQAATSGRHLMLLLNDLLDRAAVESGRLRIDPRDCFVEDLVRDAEKILAPIAASRGSALAVEIAPEVARAVRADPTRVLQVLFNLVGNALKYSPSGSPVALRATAVERGVLVEVQDRGIGVPEPQRGLLFRRFSRVHDASSSSASGSGIGLWVCKALIDGMGGEIGHKDAADGCGSVFWFRLDWVPGRPPSGERSGVSQEQGATA